jgi:iron(III) transport system permease protein
MLLPLAYLLIRDVGASSEAWGLLFRLRTLAVLGRTALLVVLVTGVAIAVAVPLAWLTSRTDLPLRRAWAMLSALPLVIPSYVGAFLIISALGPRGLIQEIVGAPLGVDRLPSIYGLPGAALTLALLNFPYVFLTVRSAFMRLDPALEESARSLGLSPLATFLRVTVPQLRPAIAAGGLLVALYVISDFGAVSLFRYQTFTWTIFQQFESALDRSVIALLSTVLVAFTLVILAVEGQFRGRLRYHRAGTGAARAIRITGLGRWKPLALAFCGAITFASLVLPLGVLLYWLVRGITVGQQVNLLWNAALNSLFVSLLAAIAAVLCALPVVIMSVRYPGWLSRFIERSCFIGYGLPGVVVALSLVFFGARYAPPVYQTAWLLVFAYVVLFLPAAMGALRSSLLQVGPRLEDAARSLGRTPAQAFLAVIVPLIRPGIFAGAALVFLVTMKELPATLILGPLGFGTLATAVWSASSAALFAQAAAPALLIVLASSASVALLMIREGRPSA